ncbi:hypothetical protein Poli38472_000309 [Pythium oligandrum]|uniref:Enoyl-CoA hydratase n=1 Tax=Pythium oligandrum TaxID=41045 RepID=A0A8K1CDG4_PYTOL|nr:hypothetical protein Poli38472_000309 [Pythium oligandrum]|eukprot:TMW60267.1 hypothetical protein Poli38472_000309 [Pythium oligandrum]
MVRSTLTRGVGAVLRPARNAAFSNMRSMSSVVTLEKQGRVGILRLNDPKRLNPMTGAMGQALEEKVAEINKRADEFGAIVLTGEGRAFSAGGDMKFLNARIEDTPSRNSAIMREFYGRYLSLRTLKVPLVAAINGPAIGAGLCITLFADVRVAAEDAKMGFTFVNLGLHPGMASSHFLPQLVGPETANYLMLSGKVFDGKEAERLRLVSKAVPNDQVVDEAVKIATEMATASSTAVRGVLRSLRAKQDAGLDIALQREADAQAHSYASPDYAEGLKAIAEKRAPQFGDYEHYN